MTAVTIATQPSRTDNSNMAGHTWILKYFDELQAFQHLVTAIKYQVIRACSPLVAKQLDWRHPQVGLILLRSPQ